MSKQGRSAVLRRRYCVHCKQKGVTKLADVTITDGGMSRAWASVLPEKVAAIFIHEGCPVGGERAGTLVDLRGDDEKMLERRWGLRRERHMVKFE